jgi:hypothetical protein
MYQDSGLLLRGASGTGFAGRRVARRMEQGVVPTRAWRSTSGAVLRLLPDHLGALAAEVRAAVHPAHPAVADPHAAVLHHVAGLARAARPAGTVTDRATGRTLHVFRAPGRAGEMEIVTAPPRGALFDIVEVRPAGMQGELEVYQDQAQGSMVNQRRVRGAHATINWTPVQMATFMANPQPYNRANVLYIVMKTVGFGQAQFPYPRYVGEATNLLDRWAPQLKVLRTFEAPLADFTLWIGTVAPSPNVTLLAHLAQVRLAPGTVDTPDKREELIRADIEHVLIRRINNELPSRVIGTIIEQLHVQGNLTGPDLTNDLVHLGVVPQGSQAAAVQIVTAFLQAFRAPQAQTAQQAGQQAATALLDILPQHNVPVQLDVLKLLNRKSIARVRSDGISVVNNMANGGPAPWFLPQLIGVPGGQDFEFPADAGALLGTG